jgi:hypothetical protein
MTLVAENDPSVRTTFGKPGSPGDIAVFHQGRSTARVQGKHLDARLSTNGETLFTDPDSIELSGSVTLHSRVTADKAYFVWTAPDVSLILEQPRVMHEPSFHDGVIGLDSPSVDAATGMSKRFQVVPLMDRCSACGHYPNSQPDLDLMACVPGEGACLRCVSWEC